MAHGFGANPGSDDPLNLGANTGRLISVEDGYDPVTGLPRMGGIPVRILPQQSGEPMTLPMGTFVEQ